MINNHKSLHKTTFIDRNILFYHKKYFESFDDYCLKLILYVRNTQGPFFLGMAHLVASFEKQEALKTYSNPDHIVLAGSVIC
jgi:hypothetical protein